MRIAFSTLAFPDASLATAAALGRAWGYDGIELRLVDGDLIDPAMPAAERARVKRTLAGFPVVAVDTSVQLTGGDPVPEIVRFLQLASDWEAPLVRVFGGGSGPGGGGEPALDGAARVLECCLPDAERLGVAIGVETHDVFSASSLVARLLTMVDSPWVGAVWDSHHPCRVGETPGEVYANLGGRILLAQVKDARRTGPRGGGGAPSAGYEDWELVLLGDGEVPVRDMVGLLAAGGYPGWVSVEWEKHWHREIAEPEVALPQYRQLLRTWGVG